MTVYFTHPITHICTLKCVLVCVLLYALRCVHLSLSLYLQSHKLGFYKRSYGFMVLTFSIMKTNRDPNPMHVIKIHKWGREFDIQEHAFLLFYFPWHLIAQIHSLDKIHFLVSKILGSAIGSQLTNQGHVFFSSN